MKKYIIGLAVASIVLTSCDKDWTKSEADIESFEKIALEDLKEKRDQYKWTKESEITGESKAVMDKYFAELTEYKKKAWLNGGDEVGQKPMFYFWYADWNATPGIPKSWLQSIPDSVTCVSIWGGLGGKRPSELTPEQKKDIEVFHQKGSAILMCWQTPSVGIALPGKKDGSIDGYRYFREKYPFDTRYEKWAEIYARELSRYIIALDFDGYDVDWETCGDHRKDLTEEEAKKSIPLMVDHQNPDSNIAKFVREMAKYFGPVGAEHTVKTQQERERNLQALFDAGTAGFDPKETELIEELKPFLPKNYLTKRYYFCADVPCGVARVFETEFEQHFDKHFMQDYTIGGVGTHIKQLGGKLYNSTSANYQSGGFGVVPAKARAISNKQIWGFGAYHGGTDYGKSSDDPQFQVYMSSNGVKRKYNHYAWTREAIRIADPRPSYFNTKEFDQVIITP
ncbi:glycoside hydrolase family 18 [Capnocytophaga sp.]|uniref:glycoside hydrolase family 18 n=1 Tax=Capnocytophaga sp. TaxID=44737 RepID=UPI0026DBE63C|nr:glycoside hydrolase family 18 [Capnocytophaga sp.]MDO5105433.1 glycoside hydrolase family 18 [Capnocytophaga sp.]